MPTHLPTIPRQYTTQRWRSQDDPDPKQPFFNFLFDGPVSVDVKVKLSPLAATIIIMFIVVLIVAIITIYKTFNSMCVLNKM